MSQGFDDAIANLISMDADNEYQVDVPYFIIPVMQPAAINEAEKNIEKTEKKSEAVRSKVLVWYRIISRSLHLLLSAFKDTMFAQRAMIILSRVNAETMVVRTLIRASTAMAMGQVARAMALIGYAGIMQTTILMSAQQERTAGQIIERISQIDMWSDSF